MNAIGQRSNVAQTGSAFPTSNGWNWGYDSLGQVISAEHAATPANHRVYQYDAIGNRQRAAAGILDPQHSSAITYAANSLNQYTAVGTVTPLHDADGNMTSGQLPTGSAGLVWDAENRLIAANITGGDTVHYFYDSQSRRIARTVGTDTTLFVYDAWNVIAEHTFSGSPFALSKTHLWGTDLSGSMQGAGGVGGLLAVTDHSSSTSVSHFPTYDGNGNISEFLDSAGTIAAHFEYDPFGNAVVNTDTTNQFPYRFSTKPIDETTGLYYYGYRWYDPATGRWPSRDPIGEIGGMNLYEFVRNDGINGGDFLGLSNIVERNCETTTVEFTFNESPLIPSIGVGIFVDGGYTMKFSFQKKTCEVCCSNQWKERKEYSYEAASGSGNIRVIGGAVFRGSTGPLAVDAWAGVKAEGEFKLNIVPVGSSSIVKGGCDKDKSAIFLGKISGRASIEGGFDASVWVHKWSFSLVRGVVGGEIGATGSVEIECDDGGCHQISMQPFKVEGDIYGEVCFMGWCHKSSLLD